MKAQRYVSSVSLPSILAAGMLYAGTVLAATGTPMSDEWLEGRISGALAYNSAIDSSDVSVDANGGIITLTGKVPTVVERDFVESVARSVDGVTTVKNELTVDENMQFESKSGFRQKLTDASITAAVKAKLLANKATHGFAIGVDTAGNVVTLTGKVSSKAEQAAAEQIAFRTDGVHEVRNQLVVDQSVAAKNDPQSKDAATAVSDAWISTKVRAILNFSSDYRGSDVDVKTANGRVTLQGVARSPEQKTLIESAVADVNGVTGVDNQMIVRKQMQGGA